MSAFTSTLRLVAISSLRSFSQQSSCREKAVYLYRPLAVTRCLCTTPAILMSQMQSVKRISTTPATQTPKNKVHRAAKPSLLSRLKDATGVGSMSYNRFKMRITGKYMYSSCVEDIDIEAFFRVCNLPDTFYSWFLVTQLHVWMCMVRLKEEGKEGKYITHYLVISMWHDIQERGRVLGVSSTKMREALQEMLAQFHGILFAYDEGLMSGDKVLAAALWRNVFARQCQDPQQLMNMVEYVRKQIQYLDTLKSVQLIRYGRIQFLPFTGEIPKAAQIPSHPEERRLHDPLEMPGEMDRIPGV